MKSKSINALIFFLFLSFYGKAQIKIWTFKECVDRAVEQNISLNQEKLNNEIDHVNLRQAHYNRTPSLNATGTQGFNSGRSIDPSSNQFVTQNIRTNNFSLGGSITLFNGLQNLNTIKQNKLNYEAGKMDIAQTRNTVILNLSSAYLGVLLTYEKIVNAQNQVNITEAQVARTNELVNSGKIAELDLYKIKAQLEADKVIFITAENELVLSKLSLAQIMNIPSSENFEIEKINLEVVPEYIAMSSEDLYNTSIGVLPVVRSASMMKRSSMVGLRISRGALLPRLVLNGSLNTNYSTARTLNTSQISALNPQIGYVQGSGLPVLSAFPSFTTIRNDYPFGKQLNDNIGKSFVFTLTVPILNNRLVRSNIEKAQINIKSAELNEQNVHNMLRKDIEQSHANMKASYKKYEATQRQLEALEKSYTGTELKYNLGITSSTDLIIEKNNLVKGQSDFLQAKYEYLFNAKIIDLYVGKEITF